MDAMPGTSIRRRAPFRWLKHSTLVGAEAMLLVGAAQQLLSQRIGVVKMPNAARIVVTMAMVLGVLTGLNMLMRLIAHKGMSHTHDVAKALPIPAATVLAHCATFACLFLLYAVIWHLPFEIPGVGTIGEPKT